MVEPETRVPAPVITQSYEFIRQVKDAEGNPTHKITVWILPPGSEAPEGLILPPVEYPEFTYASLIEAIESE